MLLVDDDAARCPRDGTSLIGGLLPTEGAAFAQMEPRDRDDADGEAGPAGLAPGTRVGDFAVTERIGRGGMGTVYAGVHPVIGKRVAIKVLDAAHSADPLAAARFIREAQAVNRIGHPSIVDIFLQGQLPDGRLYLVMELLEGETLRARYERGALATGEVVRILRPAVSALAAAHRADIVHRDLKPENIFLARDGEGGERTKLLDFGIAKLRTGGAAPGLATTSLIGTPHYMSPEQCVSGPIDHRSDLYSLGVVLYEGLTGQRPFPGVNWVEVAYQHINTRAPPPSTIAAAPPGLERLALALLAKRPEDRPQSAEEVLAALVAETAGVESAAQHLAHRPRFSRRARWAALVGLAAVLAAILGTTLTRAPASRASAPPAVAAPRGVVAAPVPAPTGPPAPVTEQPAARAESHDRARVPPDSDKAKAGKGKPRALSGPKPPPDLDIKGKL